MSGHLLRSLNVYGYYLTLGVSLAMLLYLFVFISDTCRAFGPGYDCRVGVGWIGFGMAFAGIAGYSCYRIWREGV